MIRFRKKHAYVRIDTENDIDRCIHWIDYPYQCTKCGKTVTGSGFSGSYYPEWDNSKCLGSPEARELADAKMLVEAQTTGKHKEVINPTSELSAFFGKVSRGKK